jgi:outer membrane protein assembly factor BamB
MLALALVGDVVLVTNAPGIAAYVKSRHGWFDQPAPLEPDRKVEPVANGLASLSLDGTRVFVLGEKLLTARTLDGQELWRADVNTAGVNSRLPPAIGTNGLVYVLERNELAAFDNEGTKRWVSDIAKQWTIRDLLVGSDGTLYAAGDRLWCLSADGAVRWDLESVEQGIDAIERAADETLLVRMELRGGMRVGPDGVIRTKMPLVAPLAFDGRLNVTYAGGDRYLATLAADGQEIRRVAVDEMPFAASISSDGSLYVTAGALYAFTSDGVERWHFRPRDVLRSKPIFDDDGDIVIAGRRRVFALRPDGVLRWQADLLQASGTGLRDLRVTTRGRDVYVQGWFSGTGRLMRLTKPGTP